MLVKGRRCPTFYKIKFMPEYRGKWYKWVASTHRDQPEVIRIHKHTLAWDRDSYETIYEHLINIFAHEAIHQICYWMGESANFDHPRLLFREQNKKQCPKTWKVWDF